MITKKTLLAKKNTISNLARQAGVSYLALFGSVARNEQRIDSDVDILIKFGKKNKSYFDLIKLEQDLSTLLQTKVSVQTQDTISSLIFPYIQKDLTLLYDQK